MAQSQRYLHCLQNWKSTLHFCSSHQNPRENSSCMHLYRNVTPRGSYHTRGGGLCSWLKLSSFSDISLCEWRRAVSRFGNRIPSVILWLRRRIWSICSSCHGHVDLGLLWLPGPYANLHDFVFCRWLVDQVADPGMPPGLDLTGIQLLVLVINPSCPQRKFFLQVLIVFIAVAVGSNQHTGFGIADIVQLVAIFFEPNPPQIPQRSCDGRHCGRRDEVRELLQVQTADIKARARWPEASSELVQCRRECR